MPSQDELEYGYFACPSMAGLCDAAQQVYAKGYKLEFWEDTNRVGFIQFYAISQLGSPPRFDNWRACKDNFPNRFDQ